jgi:hypothetical protein
MKTTELPKSVKLEYLDVTVLRRGVGEVRGGGESSSMLISVEGNAVQAFSGLYNNLRRLLALKTNEWKTRMDLANHCAAFPGLSFLNTRAVRNHDIAELRLFVDDSSICETLQYAFD